VKLLLLTYFFEPDLSAGSFRATSLANALRERAPAGTTIDVVTTSPNRYGSFAASAPALESRGNVTIHRIALPTRGGGFASQSRAFFAYARAVRQFTRDKRYDLVYATSSRLMTAALGANVAKKLGAPLYLDIRDIFVDTIGDLFPAGAAGLARMVFSQVERYTMRGAARINLVSRGFEEYFRARYPDRSYSWHTNGIDDEFLDFAASGAAGEAPRAGVPALVVYAGNIGQGQELHSILPGLAKSLRGRARFLVLGDGGRREALSQALAAAGIDNVEMRPPVPRAQILELYRSADVLFVHLGPHAAFEKVLPSKLFEYAATGKPLLAGIAGYSARFVATEITNAAVFPPSDVAAGVRAFESLTLATQPRSGFLRQYARAGISRAMADEILALAGGRV